MLVNMPYGVLERPSIGLGNLHAALEGAGIAVRTLNANLRFAERVEVRRYRAIGMSSAADLVGEWTFSQAAFGDFPVDLEGYRESIYLSLFEALGIKPTEFWQGMEYLRSQAAPFVDEVAREIVASGARVVGCTSVFQQHCPALALLKRVRELDPGIVTMMGGANCEGPMGLATRRNFPWVDYVVSGEADQLIVPLVRGLLGRAEPERLEGVLDGSPLEGVPRAVVGDLNELPVPNFDDYFRELAQGSLSAWVAPALPLETARGCWWGARHHCTFCGLNGSGMGFRLKSPQRALEEFACLQERYAVSDFLIVDNILAMEYFKSVLPELARQNRGYRIFVETKANLKRSQLQTLAAAGVQWVLPGLESLNDDLLRLMAKGTTGLINVQTLKWARELGLHVSWSLLCGFPGDQDGWYAQTAEWVPLLEHLHPPAAVCPIGYHRFSPYHERPEDFGIRYQPCPGYAAVYPLPLEELRDLAYFFVDAPGSARTGEEGPGLTLLRSRVRDWARGFADPQALPTLLSMVDTGEALELVDTRRVAPVRRRTLTGLRRQVYLACDSAQTLLALGRSLGLPPETVAPILAELEKHKLVLCDGQRYLALATLGSLPTPPAHFPGGTVGLQEPGAERPWLERVRATRALA